MANVFDIKMFGDKALQRKFNRLPEVVQREILPPIMKRSLNRMIALVALAWSGGIVQEKSGRAADAFAKVKVKVFTGSSAKDMIGFATALPDRESLGIDPKDKWYYPVLIEYGVSRGKAQFAAKAPIRKTVEANSDREIAIIGRELGAAIESRARRL